MVRYINDQELIGEISRRLEESRKAIHDLEIMTKKLEAVNRKLQESEALKTNFLSNIRNEINNPLSSIMALSEQIHSHAIESPMVPRVAQMIFAEAFELDFQLNNVFIAAELEAGETQILVARLDVEKFISSVIDMQAHKFTPKRITVNFKCECPKEDESCADGFFFNTDAKKLQAIITNLLANAIEFSLEGKSITIHASRENDHLRLSVKDEGVGIANEDQKNIFDRFRQLSYGVRKSHKGHGLGLSIVKALIDMLNGTITFESVVGHGCEFVMTIPEFESLTEVDVFSEESNEFIFDTEEEF